MSRIKLSVFGFAAIVVFDEILLLFLSMFVAHICCLCSVFRGRWYHTQISVSYWKVITSTLGRSSGLDWHSRGPNEPNHWSAQSYSRHHSGRAAQCSVYIDRGTGNLIDSFRADDGGPPRRQFWSLFICACCCIVLVMNRQFPEISRFLIDSRVFFFIVVWMLSFPSMAC